MSKIIKASEPFIVKVQRPLATNSPVEEALIYDSDKNILNQMQLPKQIKDLMGDRFKVYWWAVLYDNGYLMLQNEPFEDEDEGETAFHNYTFKIMNPNEEIER